MLYICVFVLVILVMVVLVVAIGHVLITFFAFFVVFFNAFVHTMVYGASGCFVNSFMLISRYYDSQMLLLCGFRCSSSSLISSSSCSSFISDYDIMDIIIVCIIRFFVLFFVTFLVVLHVFFAIFVFLANQTQKQICLVRFTTKGMYCIV